MPVVSKEDLEQSTCQRCGKPYKKKKFWQKYCCDSCKVIAWQLHKINKEIAK